MRTLSLLMIPTIVSLILFPGCQGTVDTPVQVTPLPEKDGVFVHISSGTADPHRVLMGLRMANVMSSDKDVLVYFDIKGVEVVLKESDGIELEPFDSSRAQLQTLMDKGVTIYVCPSCLEAAGKTKEDLIAGIQIANKDAFFDFTNGRILTLDY